MRFSLLVEDADPDRARAAANDARQAGVGGVWLTGTGDLKATEAILPLPELRVVAGDDGAGVDTAELEILVEGEEGWVEGLDEVRRRAPGSGGRLCWVLARDRSMAERAARVGVGIVLPELGDPDSAAEWVSAFERELSSPGVRPAAGRVNASSAVQVELPTELDAAVGLIERYRQAGVGEVILRGPQAVDGELVSALIAEFDDEEVRAEATSRQERLAPVVAAIEQRAAQPDQSPRQRREGPISRLVRRHQKAVVERISDRVLEAAVGNRAGLWLLVSEMAARYRPQEAGGFVGTIELTLVGRRGPQVFSIDCSAVSARARRGGSSEARLRIEAGVADFLRVGTGEVKAPEAVLDGRLNVQGDFALALRLGEMFGGPSII